jgi:hypothetical protein
MDELDKILLQHLPDTGLCERSKVKQEQRRRNLKLAVLGYMINQARNPNAVVTKEGGTIRAFMEAQSGNNHGPELIIDEMQLDQQDKPTFASGGTIKHDPLRLPGGENPNIKEHILSEEQLKRISGTK